MFDLTAGLLSLAVILVSALLCGYVAKRVLMTTRTMRDTIDHLTMELAEVKDENWHLSVANENYSRMLCKEYRRSHDNPTARYGPRIVHVKRSRLLSDTASDVVWQAVMEGGSLFLEGPYVD